MGGEGYKQLMYTIFFLKFNFEKVQRNGIVR